jgi:hypothetical protein
VRQLVEPFITDTQENGGGCDVTPGCHHWVVKGGTKSKKKVIDPCALVDQLGMLGMSEEDFIKTCTATKHIANLNKHQPRLRFETWSDMHLAAIVGRDECMSGAPDNKDQIVKNKNASRNSRLLARRSASASKPTNNSSGPSSHSRKDPSEHAFLQPNSPASEHAFSPPNDDNDDSPAPEQKMSASKVVLPMREHLASCFEQLGTGAIAATAEDLILVNLELHGKIDKLKQPSARSMCDALEWKHSIIVHLPEDADVIQLPIPTDEDKKTPALLSFAVKVNNNPSIHTLTAACRELGTFLMNRENKQSLVLPTWNGRNHIVVRPRKSQSVDAFVANATVSGWAEDLLPDEATREGMMKCLSRRHDAKTPCADGHFQIRGTGIHFESNRPKT